MRGSVWAVEEDVLSALWPLAQSFDSPNGYGYTGDNPYPHLIQGDYGGTAFYPPGYPLLLWATEKVFGDPHRASQIISGAALGLLMGGTYLLGLGWTRKHGLALVAAALVTSSTAVLTLAYAASTDLVATALTTIALAGGTWAMRYPSQRRWMIFAALALGLAFLVRRQAAVMLVPLVVLAVASAWGRGREALSAGSVPSLASWSWWLCPISSLSSSCTEARSFSSHGKNVWNAVINEYDWPAWHDVPNTISPVTVLAQEPVGFIVNWLGNLLHYAETLWLGPATLLVLPGLVLMWRRAPLRLASIVTIASAAFVVIVVSISERGDRHALILVPTLAVIAGAGIWYGISSRWRLHIAGLFCVIGILVAVAHTAQLVTDELEVPFLEPVVGALQADGANPADELTSFGSAHYAFYADVGFEPLPGKIVTWEDLRAFMDAEGIEYYVARRLELHDHRLVESLETEAAPSWMTVVWAAPPASEDSRVVLYRYEP